MRYRKQQKQLNEGKPLMWSEVKDNHTYIYRNGELVYKRWNGRNMKKTQPSILMNKYWNNEWIT